MKITDQFKGDFIDVLHLAREGDTTLTILSVSAAGVEKCADGRVIDRPVVHFDKTTKKLILNKTNARTIGLLYGIETDAWAGKKINLFLTTRDAFGQKDVAAIGVRATDPDTGRSINIFSKPKNKKS